MFWYLVFSINMMIYYFCFLFDMGYCCVDQAILLALGLRSSFDCRHIPPHSDHYCPPHLCVYLGLKPKVLCMFIKPSIYDLCSLIHQLRELELERYFLVREIEIRVP